MSITRVIKDLGWWVIDLFPFQLHYIIDFRTSFKRWPRLRHPKDYRDFIFRDCFWGHHNKRADLADKLEVRKYVEDRGLGRTLTKLYGAWDDASKIDFDALPNQFALKCNHSCGMNIICYDKKQLDIDETRKKLNYWLTRKHPIVHEQHYNHIKPMIICEEIIPNNNDGFFPMDYKIHCADGKPIYIQCCFERNDEDAGRRIIFSTDWKDLHYVLGDEHYSDIEVPKPKHLEEMLNDAAILSKGLEYVRIDLYDTDSRVIFGEVTLTPMGGILSYFTQEALDVMGSAIRNVEKNKNAGKH